MCGRFTETKTAKLVAEHFAAQQVKFDFGPRYNIAPSQDIAVVTMNRNGERVLDGYHWGLIPSWAKDESIGNKMINARAETVGEKPSFKNALKRRRCLIPADGFYEWEKVGKSKVPHHIRLREGELFAFAGLWEEWQAPDGKPLRSCTIITTTPNELTEKIHNRMPVILPPDLEEAWLDSGLEPEAALAMLRPYDARQMEEYIVDRKVGNAAYDAPDLVVPVPKEEGEEVADKPGRINSQ